MSEKPRAVMAWARTRVVAPEIPIGMIPGLCVHVPDHGRSVEPEITPQRKWYETNGLAEIAIAGAGRRGRV
jgi:hypothetical protein